MKKYSPTLRFIHPFFDDPEYIAVLAESVRHHVREEEQEQFVAAQKHLAPADVRYMRRVFNRRKKAEKAGAEVEKKIKLKD